MIPKMEVQTIQPAKHLRENIQMNDTTMENPNAAKSHFQFYAINLNIYLFEIIDEITESAGVTCVGQAVYDSTQGISQSGCGWDTDSIDKGL